MQEMKLIKKATNKYFREKEAAEDEIDLVIKEFTRKRPCLSEMQILLEVKTAYKAINEHRKSAGALASMLAIASGIFIFSINNTFFTDKMTIPTDTFLVGLISFLIFLFFVLVPVAVYIFAFSWIDAKIRNKVYRSSISLDVIEERIESFNQSKQNEDVNV